MVVSMARKTRVTVDVDSVPRTVLAIRENRNSSDLTLHVTGQGQSFFAPTFSELLRATRPEPYMPAEKHISIHSNPRSDETNTIKRTVKGDTLGKHTQVHLTRGIKEQDRFVPVWFRVCSDLTADRFCVPADTRDHCVSLGQLTPRNDRLQFMVVVSRAGTVFHTHEEHPSQVVSLQYRRYQITLIYSWFNQPAHPQAIDLFFTTNIQDGPSDGLEAWQVYNLYTELYGRQAEEYWQQWPGGYPET